MGEDQFSFKKGKRTRDAIGCTKNLGERIYEVSRETCACCIDWEKRFSKVDWNMYQRFWKTLVYTGMIED